MLVFCCSLVARCPKQLVAVASSNQRGDPAARMTYWVARHTIIGMQLHGLDRLAHECRDATRAVKLGHSEVHISPFARV